MKIKVYKVSQHLTVTEKRAIKHLIDLGQVYGYTREKQYSIISGCKPFYKVEIVNRRDGKARRVDIEII